MEFLLSFDAISRNAVNGQLEGFELFNLITEIVRLSRSSRSARFGEEINEGESLSHFCTEVDRLAVLVGSRQGGGVSAYF